MLKKIVAIILSVCMIVTLVPAYAFAAEETKELTNYFSLGIPIKDDTTPHQWNFSNVTLVNDDTRPIKYAKIEFASSFVAGSDSLNLESNTDFTATRNDRGTKIEITPNRDNLTNEDWADYLKNFYAILTSNGIEYAISISSNIEGKPKEEGREFLYRAETDHYYEYVPADRISWDAALQAAREKNYLGRQGYLITVTSAAEAQYVADLIGVKDGWLAGTREFQYYPENVTKNVQELNEQNCQSIGKDCSTLLSNDNAWFWADGADDEAGFIYYPARLHTEGYDGNFQYTNWGYSLSASVSHKQPDNGDGNASGNVETCMQFQSGSCWNDLAINSRVGGYFVEYGGKITDEIIPIDRTTAIISPINAEKPTFTSKFNEEVGVDPGLVTKDCVTTVKDEKIKPNSFILSKKDDATGNYNEVNGADGIGKYQMIASYMDGDGNSYYSEKNAEIEAIKLKIQLNGLDPGDIPGDYPSGVKEIDMEPGGSYVAEAPVIDGYIVDVLEQTVDNIKTPKTIVFTYTKQQNCNVKVVLEGLGTAPDDSWAPESSTFTKTISTPKGDKFIAVAPVVAGYLVDRYAVTLDPVTKNETVVFHYVKEGAGNEGRNVRVQLKGTDGKTLSVPDYATKYVVEKGAPVTVIAPEIPGYTFQSGTVTPQGGGVLTGSTFTADAVEKNTTVTFTYKKLPEHTITVLLEKHDGTTVTTETHATATVSEGDSYTAIAPQIAGYTVNKIMETVSNVTEDTTITFIYSKPEELALHEVTVELLEKTSATETAPIDPPEGFISKYYITHGGGFSLTPPVLNGYNYVAPAVNAAVTPLKGPIKVQFFYEKPKTYTVTVRLEGASLAGYPLKVEVPEGEQYTAIAPLIDGKKADKYSETVTADRGGIEIVFKYKNVKGPSTPKPPEEEPPESPVGGVLNADDHIRYMAGHASGLFGPEGDLTRAQCAQIFYNLLLDKDAAQPVSFPDVPEDKWYARAIETLAGMDVLRGYNDGTFQPEKSITRAEFTAIAMRFGELDKSGENPFPDVTEDRWYYSDVVGSAKYGWIQGYTDGTFRPEEKISRTEVTYIVNRMLKRTADQTYIDANPEALASFPDLPSSYWGYYSIMEATNAHDHIWKDKSEVWMKIR